MLFKYIHNPLFQCARPGWAGAYLFEGSLGSKEFVEKADRNAQHGGQSQTPADHLAPPWVHVHIVVGQGLIVHQVEQKDTLREERGD